MDGGPAMQTIQRSPRISGAAVSTQAGPSGTRDSAHRREWRTPSVPEQVLLGWLVCADLGRRWLTVWLGSELVGGAARWRCAFGLPTQLVVLPALCYRASRAEAHGIPGWSARCSSRGLGPWGAAFAYVFGAAMLYDFVAVRMRPVLVAHHVVSLLAHAYACLRARARPAFPWYALGVAALEIGSAAASAFWLIPPSRTTLVCFLVLMTLSNIAGLACTGPWWREARNDGPAAHVGAAVSVALIGIRQWEAAKVSGRIRLAQAM